MLFQREGFTPLWFQLEEEAEGEEGVARWAFNNKYWDQRQLGFTGVPFEPVW